MAPSEAGSAGEYKRMTDAEQRIHANQTVYMQVYNVVSMECVLFRKVHANQTVNMQMLSNRDLAAALERNAEDVDTAWVDLCELGAVPGIHACMYLTCMYMYV